MNMCAVLVEQVAGDRAVLVGVGQVGVEVLGQPGLGVEREQSPHHLQAVAGLKDVNPTIVRLEVSRKRQQRKEESA